jgi:hypothetical protein
MTNLCWSFDMAFVYSHGLWSLLSLYPAHAFNTQDRRLKRVVSSCLDLLDVLFVWADFRESIRNKGGREQKDNMKNLWTSRVFGFAFIIPTSLYCDDRFHLVLSRFPMVSQWLFSKWVLSSCYVFFNMFPNSTFICQISFELIFALWTESWSEFPQVVMCFSIYSQIVPYWSQAWFLEPVFSTRKGRKKRPKNP